MVANLTTESPALRDEARRILEEDPEAEFEVVVPMSGLPPTLALFSAVDGHTLRMERAVRARRRLIAAGATHVGVHLARMEPLDEIDDVLGAGGFAAVIVSTLPHRLSHWLRTDLPGRISRRHRDLEVRVIVAPADLYEDQVIPRHG